MSTSTHVTHVDTQASPTYTMRRSSQSALKRRIRVNRRTKRLEELCFCLCVSGRGVLDVNLDDHQPPLDDP